MSDDEFIDLVAKMRSLQVEYFKTRDHDVLRRCKEAEREVDAAIHRVQSPGLF